MKKIVFCDFSSILDIEARLDIYKKCGIKSVQPLWGVDVGQSEQYRFDFYAAAKRHGLKMEIVHFDKDRGNLMHQPDKRGDEYVELVKKYIAEVAERNVKVAIFHPSYDRNPPPPNDLSVKRMREIIAFAEKSNVIIAIENLDSNMAFEMYLEKINSPNLKILFDIGHTNCFSHDTFELFKRHKDRIIATHLHNNWGKDWIDEHNSLDDGNIDIKKFVNLKSKIQYYLIEALPRGLKTPQEFEAFVRHNYNLLLEWIAK